MLEILILYKLCKRIGAAARDKGHRSIGYQLLLVLFWFGGEIGAAIACAILLFVLYGEHAEAYVLFAYLAGFSGAASARGSPSRS